MKIRVDPNANAVARRSRQDLPEHARSALALGQCFADRRYGLSGLTCALAPNPAQHPGRLRALGINLGLQPSVLAQVLR